jgi:ribokinase
MTFDVVGFGALNLDRLFKVNMIAKEEEEASVLDFKESGGGSAANTIVGLTRLEIKTGFIGKVAADREGKCLLNELKKEGVDINGVTISEVGRTGTVMGYVDPNADRALYVDPGVNDQLDFNDINVDYVSGADFLHLSSFVGEKPFKAQKQLIKIFSDVKLCFDPGTLYAKKGLTILKPLLKRSYTLFPNEIEVRLITGQNYLNGAKKLIDLGAEIVAIKLGKRGCYVSDGKESHLIKSYKIEAVDTTGAGDAFCAGFIYGLINGKDLYKCGKLGNFVASRCVSKMGARTGLPQITDLKAI